MYYMLNYVEAHPSFLAVLYFVPTVKPVSVFVFNYLFLWGGVKSNLSQNLESALVL